MAEFPPVGIEVFVKGVDKAVSDAGRASGAIKGIAEAAEETQARTSVLDGVSKRMQDIGDNLSGIGLKMTGALTLPLVGFGTMAVMTASNLEESMNKVDVVFGESGEVIKQFAKDAATNLGMSEQAALDAAGTYGNLFTSMGIGTDTAADMSSGLLQLAADLASFNNIDPTLALEKLRAGLVGETEPLRTLGVNLTAVAVEAKAMSMGLAASKDEITPAIAAQARYALILEQTQNAQGDFARTSDGLANQMRIVKAQVANTAASFGKILLPFVQKAVTWIANLLTKFQTMSPTMQKVIVIVGVVVAAIGPLLMIVGSLVSAIGTILPVIGAVVGVLSGPVLLVIGAVIAVVALLAAAWKNNWGGIQEKTRAVWDWLKGVFGGIVEWFQNYIPAAIAVLKQWWEGTLLPALQAVWDFIQTYIMPILSLLADIFKIVLTLAVQAFVAIWNNVLLPAFTTVWTFIKTKIIPIFTSLRDFIVNEIGPKILWFKTTILDPLATTLKEGVGAAVKWVYDKLKALKDLLLLIKIPKDWLAHSPSPFELSLTGIGNSVAAINQGLVAMSRSLTSLPSATVGVSYQSSGLSSPGAVASMMRPVAAPAMAGMGGGSTYNVPITVNANVGSDQDVHKLAYVIASEFNKRTHR